MSVNFDLVMNSGGFLGEKRKFKTIHRKPGR